MWWTRIRVRSGQRVQRSTGMTSVTLANAVRRMLDHLEAQREWTLLQALADGRLTVDRLYDDFAADRLDETEAALSDVDLEPLVKEWAAKPRGMQTADSMLHHQYRQQVRTLIPEGKPFMRSALTPERIEQWLDSLSLSAPTRNRYLSALSMFCRWLQKPKGVLSSNPC